MNHQSYKTSFREKLRYWFDKQMAKGTGVRIGMLIGASMIMILVFTLVDMWLDPGSSFLSGFWKLLMRTFDPGNMADDPADQPSIIIMLTATLFGMFVTATLISIINNGLEGYMEKIAAGNSKVLEEDHTIILGYNDITNAVIGQLIEANANERLRQKIVVLGSGIEKDEMQSQIHAFIGENDLADMSRHTEIISRIGTAWNPSDLEMCGIRTARSIIINLEDDDEAVKAIMACAGILHQLNEEGSGKNTYICAVIREQENMDAARIAGGKYLEAVCYQDLLSRIIANSSRSPGLSYVITELFNYEDNEIYTVRPQDIDGNGTDVRDLTPFQLNNYLENAIVIGGLREETDRHLRAGLLSENKFAGAESCLFPSMLPADPKIGEFSQLYVIEQDNDRISLVKESIEAEAFAGKQTIDSHNDHPMLIIGANSVLLQLMHELGGFLDAQTDLFIFDTQEKIDAYMYVYADQIKKLQEKLNIHFIGIDVDDFNTLYAYIHQHPECLKAAGAVILADDDVKSDYDRNVFEKSDDKTLARLLFMRKIRDDLMPDLSITCEMNLDANRRLAELTGKEDFIVGSSITALVITQIAQTRQLHRVFHEILDESGSELYMLRALDLMGRNEAEYETDWIHLSALFAGRNEILIGYRLFRNGSYELPVINPPRRNPDHSVIKLVLKPEDELITIGNRSHS